MTGIEHVGRTAPSRAARSASSLRREVGTGNPWAPLEERSKDELYNLAEESGVKGRSRMNKNQLITAIRRVRGPEV